MLEGTPKKLDLFGWMGDFHGCGQIRVRNPMGLIREQGKHVGYGGMLTKDPNNLPKTLLGQRICKDGPSRIWFDMAVQKNRPRMVFELDDDLWNVDPSSYSAYEWFHDGYDRETGKFHNVKPNLARNIAVSDVVTCTTEPLAEIMSQWNPNVHIVPNYLPAWMLDWERPKPARDRLTIGWEGSGTHSMDWDYCLQPIKRFLDRNPNVDLSLIGTEDPTLIGIPRSERVHCQGWFGSVEDCWKAINFDIGIIPLRPHVFNQSKSNLKFLENAMLGIPTVAADVGPYSRTIEHGKTGFLVKQDHEWSKYLRILVEDEDARNEIAYNAKEWAKTMTLEGNISRWTDVLFEE